MTRARVLLVAGLAWASLASAEEIADAPAVTAAQAPVAAAPTVPFACPQEGRVGTSAPTDYHEGADARCVAEGTLAVLYGPDGAPLPRMTKVGPGWYFSAEGYRLADTAFRQVQRERSACRDELAARGDVPLPGVPVAPPALSSGKGWPSGVVIAVGVASVLVGGLAGCYAAGGCR